MPPQLSLPVDNATSVDTSTTFLYNQGTGNGVNLVQIVGSSSSYPDYFIFTKSNSVTIPNLSAQGLGLPGSSNYGWQVLQISPLNSVDDAASESFISLINKNSGDIGAGVSEDYEFSTKSN